MGLRGLEWGGTSACVAGGESNLPNRRLEERFQSSLFRASDDTPVSTSGTDMKATPASTAIPTTTFDICVNAPIALAQRAAL